MRQGEVGARCFHLFLRTVNVFIKKIGMVFHLYDILTLKYTKDIEQICRDCLENVYYREDAHCEISQKATKATTYL